MEKEKDTRPVMFRISLIGDRKQSERCFRVNDRESFKTVNDYLWELKNAGKDHKITINNQFIGVWRTSGERMFF